MSDVGTYRQTIARKAYRCKGCFGPIGVKERHWHFHGKYMGEWQNIRLHAECMEAVGDEEGWFAGSFPVPERLAGEK